jgi:hypothetical protein
MLESLGAVLHDGSSTVSNRAGRRTGESADPSQCFPDGKMNFRAAVVSIL